MRPPKYKNLGKSGLVSFLAILITMNLLLTSCVEEIEAPKIEIDENTQIAQLKSWFEENKTKLRLPERGSNFRSESQELVLPFFEKEPDWDKFHHYYFPDGREVFEMNLENAQTFLPSSESDAFDQEAAQRIIQNILFVKHPSENRFDPLIVRYYPDEETSIRDFNEINYQMIDEKWSGTVDLFTYDEHYFMGFEIHKGQILATRQMESIPDGRRKYIGKENMDFRCSVTTTDWYQISYVIATNTWVVDQLMPTRSYSCGMGSYNPESSSGGTYSYGGGSTSSGTGGGTAGYNPPDVPMPMLRIYIDTSISNDPRLSCIVNKLSMTAFVTSIAEFTKTKDSQQNSVIKLGPIGTDRNGQTQSRNGIQEITINSNTLNRPDLLIAKTIIHELVHAEINVALRNKGQTVLDNNFAANFDKFINVMYGTNNTQGDLHHKYMAENLLSTMGAALMDVHKNYFPEDFQKLNNYLKINGYPKGVSLDFYVNLCWQGLEGTLAFNQMKSITTNYPIKSPFQKHEEAKDFSRLLTKPCGN